jgi:hypothetical protein
LLDYSNRYHIVKQQQHIYIAQAKPNVETALTISRRLLPEMLLLLVQVPPGIHFTFEETNFTGNVAVHRLRVFNAVCFFRMYTFVRVLKTKSDLESHALDISAGMKRAGLSPRLMFIKVSFCISSSARLQLMVMSN